jgi:hypothetical protein
MCITKMRMQTEKMWTVGSRDLKEFAWRVAPAAPGMLATDGM